MHVRRMVPFAALLSIVGCRPATSTADGGPAASAEPEDPVAALERETGQHWTVRFHSDLHTPAFAQGRTGPMARTPQAAEHAGRAFLRRHAALFGTTEQAMAELVTEGADTDELGMTHARFAQRHARIPVWASELLLHFDRDGALVRFNGRYQPIVSADTTPARGAGEARAAAEASLVTLDPTLATQALSTVTPRLWLYPTAPTEVRLAWRVETAVSNPTHPQLVETFVDAMTGAVLHQVDTLEHLGGSGKGFFGDERILGIAQRRGEYVLEDDDHGAPGQRTYTAKQAAHLPGTEVASRDPKSWDVSGPAAGAAVDAHAHVATTYDYYAKVHGRAGWDGRGRGVQTTVHFGSDYGAAFFDGKRLVFGDGDASLSSPASALDIVAHEFAHGVTRHTARLGSEGESGALNEAISDVFACFVTHHASGAGSWQIGASVFHPDGKPRPMRDLARPQETKNPAGMSEYVQTAEDRGGVHLNSTIVSHAAYLMTEGGRDELSGLAVDGVGLDGAQRIWFRALTRYLTQRASFADAADATVAAAADLGKGQEAAVKQAWVAVGVLTE